MPDRDQVVQAYSDHVNRSYALLHKVAGSTLEASASGAIMRDDRGDEYLQCGAFGVLTLGHGHPKVVEAVERQLRRLTMTGRLLLSPELAEASETRAARSPAGSAH